MSDILNAEATNPREGGASFSFSHRLERALWNLTWVLLGAWTPVQLHGWRRSLLRIFGAKVAKTAKVYPSAKVWYPRHLEMADYACIGPRVNCYCMAPIVLKSYALISQGAYLCGGTHDADDRHFQLKARPIEIGSNAWIATEAFVGPGVVVGEGAVLGARAVSVKDLEPWTIYAGNPARPLRRRALKPKETHRG
jgi:putative colanic acid biosynthesis acetyltransferase WcaF